MGTANNDNSEKVQNMNAPHVQPMLSSEELLSLSTEDLLARLNSTTTGLSSQEAEKLLQFTVVMNLPLDTNILLSASSF
jgi:hypothetical protein